jgi:hypothetical protein
MVSSKQMPAESYRAQVWELHLRGVPKQRIAEMVGHNRETVARIIGRCYAEIAPEQQVSVARKLGEAVARMRRVQEQAWENHDSDAMVSQRSKLLRIILDAEKEIARLEGLYEGMVDLEAGVTVTFVKLSSETEDEAEGQRGRRTRQGSQIAAVAPNRAIPSAQSDGSDDGEGDDG